MKKNIVIFLITLVCELGWAQTTYTANNNPGAVTGVNIFTGATAAQDAIAATVNGDIVYIVPSGVNYGDLGSISNEITIFGVGMDPNRASTVNSVVYQLSINSSNVRISGLVFTAGNNSISSISFAGAFNNTLIDNCSLRRITTTFNLANLVLQNNIIGNNIGGLDNGVIKLTTGCTGIRISNNIIYGSTTSNLNNDGWLWDFNGVLVENNLFVGNNSGSAQRAFRNIFSSNFKNNIFYGVRPAVSYGTMTNNTFEYNLSFDALTNSFPTTNGNTSTNDLVNVDPMFVNMPYSNGFSSSSDPNLQAGSPALGTGDAGTDRGVFGGGSPLSLTFTSLPNILSVTIPPSISQGSDLPINIKGNGN